VRGLRTVTGGGENDYDEDTLEALNKSWVNFGLYWTYCSNDPAHAGSSEAVGLGSNAAGACRLGDPLVAACAPQQRCRHSCRSMATQDQ